MSLQNHNLNNLSVSELRKLNKQVGGNVTHQGKYKNRGQLVNEIQARVTGHSPTSASKSTKEIALDNQIDQIMTVYGMKVPGQVGGVTSKRGRGTLARGIGRRDILRVINENFRYNEDQSNMVNTMRKNIADNLYQYSMELQGKIPEIAEALRKISDSLATNDYASFEGANMLLRTQLPMSLAMKLRRLDPSSKDQLTPLINKIKSAGTDIGKMQQKLPKSQQVKLSEQVKRLGIV